jgi:hypothetical protein
MTESESVSELLAKGVLETVLALEFEKVKPSNEHGRKSVDYRSVGGGRRQYRAGVPLCDGARAKLLSECGTHLAARD